MKIDGFGTNEYKIELTPEAGNKVIDCSMMADSVAFGSSFSEFFNTDVENVSMLGDGEGAIDALKSKATMLKDNLTAIFDKMETGTVVSMDGEGVDVNNTETKELVTVVEQIQIKLAMYCEDFNATVDMDSSAIKAVMGAAATFTANKELGDGTKEYLLKNNLRPTVENVYIAEHAGNRGNSRKPLTEKQWQEILPQVNKIIEKTGMPVNEVSQNMGRWLVDREIPLTTENLTKLHEMDNISVENFKERINATVMEGYKPSATLLTGKSLPWEETAKAISTLERVNNANVMWWANASTVQNLNELKVAVDNGKEMTPDFSNEKFVSATRQLQEVRLMMTINAGRALEKNNISINTVEISRLVEELKNYELEQMNRNLAEDVKFAPEEVNRANDALLAFMSLKNIPAVALGSVIKTNENVNAVTLASHGAVIKENFDKAQKAYEHLSTEIRTDLGDSVIKAVNASTEDILSNLGMEYNESNQRAVRILAFNEMDINEENIFRVKAMDESVNTLFERLNPQLALELIREGKDILSTPVDELSTYLLDRIQEVLPKEEKYSEFLYRLDKKGQIESDEREKFIGIYSMVHKFRKDDMNAVGSLLNQGLELNMGNLLTAFYSRKDKGMELAVDDNTPTIHVQDKVTYYKNLFGKISDKITPDKLENITDEMTPEEFVQEMEKTIPEEDVLFEKYLQDIKAASEMDPQVYKFVTENYLPETINEIMAVRDFLKNDRKVFSDYEKETAENKAEEFFDAMDNKEQLQKEYDRMVEDTRKILEDAYVAKDTYVDMDSLRMMGIQVNMLQKLANNNYFCIPYEGKNSEGIIHLRVVESGNEEGTFNVKFDLKNLGKVTVEGKVEADSVKAVIMCDEEASHYMTDRLQGLEEELRKNGYEDVKLSINVAKEHPQGNTKPMEKVTTRRIFNAAKIFVFNMTN